MKNLLQLQPKKKRTWILCMILCTVAAYCADRVYLHFFYGVTDVSLRPIRMGIFFLLAAIAFLRLVFCREIFYGFLYRYRFHIAASMFVICVVMQLHGSSIGMWNAYLHTLPDASEYQYPILGIARAIRSDEWLVFTPLAMSQKFNQYGVVNEIACAWPTNMLTTYNQPVWDISIVAKPFYWGYLLFGSDAGLSWFWCGRLIALFLVTFELFQVITRKNAIYSLAASFLITFASFVQWWFAINFLVEMLVAGQLAVLMLYRFLTAENQKTMLISTVVFSLCALAYLFSLYPAWMIPLFYLFVVLALWVMTEYYPTRPHSRKELWYPFAAVIFVGLVALSWFLQSKDAILTTMNTVYPGARVYTGGSGFWNLLFYINNLALPYNEVGNSCEPAMAYGFFPFTEIITMLYLFRSSKKDRLLTFLLGLDLFFLFYLVVGVPEWFAKVSLLYLTSPRIVPIICLIEILIYVRMLSLGDGAIFAEKQRNTATVALLIGLAVTLVLVARNKIPAMLNPSDGLKPLYLLCVIVMIGLFCLLFFVRRSNFVKQCFAAACVLVSMVTGLLVNPVMRTTDAIYEKPLSKAIQQIQKESPGLWISTDWVRANFFIANGAPTINSTNIIPAVERWEMLDRDGAYQDVYNRYAHIIVNLVDGETYFEEAPSPDQFILNINFEDLKKLGVTYIHTEANRELPNDQFKQSLAEIYNDGSAVIYKLAD